MSSPTPWPSCDTEHDLLFAVLLRRADLIDAEQLGRAVGEWSAERSSSFAQFVVGRGWLTPEEGSAVEQLVRHRVRRYGSPRAGLSALLTAEDSHLLRALSDGGEAPTVSMAQRPPGGPSDSPSTTGYEQTARPAAPPAPPPGGPRYTRTRLHATGGLGRVWLAHDRELGREVALKELRPDRAGHPSVRTRFVNEARITGQLEHPGIVPVYELVWDAGAEHPCYAMRFVRGRTLTEAIRTYHARRTQGSGGPLELHALLGAFVGACNAVAYAHSRGVIHRDLKPHNVVLGDFGEVILLDWGLAKHLGRPEEAGADGDAAPAADGGTLAGQVLGTPAYMAPEQADGRHDLVDRRSDVYGLGVILYELLTGQVPFRGRDTTELLRRVRQGAVTPPRQVCPATPAPLEAVCLRAMARQPEQRYASAAELADDVRSWLADEPVRAYPEPAARRLARWARRRQALVASAAAILLTLTVALGIGLGLLRRQQQETEHERQLAVVAQGRAEQSAESARQAKDEADASARSARAQRQLALDTLAILVTTVQEQLEDQPQTHELKRELLASALAGLEKVAGGADERGAADLQAAEAHQRLGDIFLVLGQTDKAGQQFEQARAIAARLLDAEAKNRDARRRLAAAQHRLALVGDRTGKVVEGRKLLVASRELLQTLLGEDPRDAAAQHELAEVASDLGDLTLQLGQTAVARDYFREGLQVAEARLRVDAKSEEAQLDRAVTLAELALLSLDQGEVAAGDELSRKALDSLRALEADRKKGARPRLALALAHRAAGDVALRAGRSGEARDHLERSLALAEKLAAADPKDVRLRRALSVAHNQVGDVYVSAGKLGDACEHYDKSIAIMQALIEAGQGPRDRQDLALAYGRLSQAQRLRGRAVEARTAIDKCPALLQPIIDADPKNLEARRDLACVEGEMGQTSEKLNDSGRAREHYERAIQLFQELVEADPQSARFKHDLALAYNKLGDLVQYSETPQAALKPYEKSFELVLAIFAIDRADLRAQYDVAVGRLRLADLRRRLNQLKEAEAECRDGLKALQAVAQADDKNLEVRRDLGYAWQILGLILTERGEAAEARRCFQEAVAAYERLVLVDPVSARFQRDLLVGLNKLGDLLVVLEPPAKALEAYEKSLKYARAVWELDRKNPQAQYDVALGLLRVASTQLELSRLADARANSERALELLRPIVADDPHNLEARRDMAHAYQYVGLIRQNEGDHAAAREALTASVERFEELRKLDPKDARRRRDLYIAYNKLGDLYWQKLNGVTTARDYFVRSLQLVDELDRESKGAASIRYDVVMGHARLGLLASQAAEYDEALKQLGQAREVVEALDKAGVLAGAPNYMPRQKQLDEWVDQCKQGRRAGEDLDWVLKQPQPLRANLLILRVKILSRQGKHAEAAQAVEKLTGLLTNNPLQKLALARTHALCAAAVGRGKKPEALSPEEKEARARYVKQALAALESAVEAGFKDAARLETDTDLEAIRGEDGYRKVAEKLKPKS